MKFLVAAIFFSFFSSFFSPKSFSQELTLKMDEFWVDFQPHIGLRAEKAWGKNWEQELKRLKKEIGFARFTIRPNEVFLGSTGVGSYFLKIQVGAFSSTKTEMKAYGIVPVKYASDFTHLVVKGEYAYLRDLADAILEGRSVNCRASFTWRVLNHKTDNPELTAYQEHPASGNPTCSFAIQ